MSRAGEARSGRDAGASRLDRVRDVAHRAEEPTERPRPLAHQSEVDHRSQRGLVGSLLVCRPAGRERDQFRLGAAHLVGVLGSAGARGDEHPALDAPPRDRFQIGEEPSLESRFRGDDSRGDCRPERADAVRELSRKADGAVLVGVDYDQDGIVAPGRVTEEPFDTVGLREITAAVRGDDAPYGDAGDGDLLGADEQLTQPGLVAVALADNAEAEQRFAPSPPGWFRGAAPRS